MKQPVNKYRYTVTNLLGVLVGAAAFGESQYRVEWSFNDDGPFDYKKEMPSKIIFREGVFNDLYNIETSINRCDFMQLAVERFCGGVWTPWFAGRFSLNDAGWNLHKCEVEIKLDKKEDDDCLQNKKSETVNLFDFVPDFNRKTVKPYAANIVIEKVTYSSTIIYHSPCETDYYWAGAGTAAAGAWAPYYHYYGAVLVSILPRCVRETRWARQTLILPVADPSPGAEWILISTAGGNNKWAKPASVFDCQEDEVINQGNILHVWKRECQILGEAGGISQIDNGMRLQDCLDGFVNKFCPGVVVKSEFFQINPDVVTAINYVTGQASKVRNIIIFQKSDVKRPAVSGNATKAETTWEKFTTWLIKMFNVRWRIEAGVLRIEHVSFFSKNNGLDLTLPRYAKNVNGLQKYSYKTEQIPAREEFKFMEASAGDFAGLPIQYTGGCVPTEKQSSVLTHAAEDVTTDVELILNNPGSDSSVVEDKGFCLIACDDANYILSEPAILSAGIRLNNSLAWAQLHRDYHKYYRILKAGIMNGQPTQFLSVQPLKKGVTLTVPFCCGDIFNPDDLITTDLGLGTVEKASFSFKDETLAIDLLYPSDLTLYIPPIAVNDMVDVYAGVVTDLGLIANDIPSPSGPITDIEIVLPPSHGGVAVAAGPVANYTPTAGFFGQDNLVYRIKDSTGVPSNNALVAINVKSGVFIHMQKISGVTNLITADCGFGPVHLGTEKKATYRLTFFSDAAGTIPFDTTGMGLIVNIEVNGVYNSPSNAAVLSTFPEPVAGTSFDLIDYFYFRNEHDCAGNLVDYHDETLAVAPGPYDII